MPAERTAQPEDVWPDGGHLPDDSVRVIAALTARCNDAERNLDHYRSLWTDIRTALDVPEEWQPDQVFDLAGSMREFWEACSGHSGLATEELIRAVDSRGELIELALLVGADPQATPSNIGDSVRWKIGELEHRLRAAEAAMRREGK